MRDKLWVYYPLTLDLTYFCVFLAFIFRKFWRWRIRIPAIIIFIVAEEEISGKCQNRKTYLNCSFKRKYQTNTKTGRRVFSKLLKNFLFEEIFKNQNLSKEDWISKRKWNLRKGLIIRHSIRQEWFLMIVIVDQKKSEIQTTDVWWGIRGKGRAKRNRELTVL